MQIKSNDLHEPFSSVSKRSGNEDRSVYDILLDTEGYDYESTATLLRVLERLAFREQAYHTLVCCPGELVTDV